mmetsp:Transcript_11300/g.13439  ORF Transcript_11300/g.13439 Transcript_11300/m.13439 type:complete len:113 (-) Transcript_11300:60-398(-)
MWSSLSRCAPKIISRRTIRSFSKEIAPINQAAASQSVAPKGSTFSQRLGAFMAGVALTATFGYVTLRRDIFEAAEGVESNIQSLHNDIILSGQTLSAKVAELEARIAELEGK